MYTTLPYPKWGTFTALEQPDHLTTSSQPSCILVIQVHAPVPGDTQFIPSVQRTGNAALPFVKTKKTWYIYKPSLLLSPLAKTKCRGLHALILCKYIVWMILFARKNRLKYV